jgi:hypothetical protein
VTTAAGLAFAVTEGMLHLPRLGVWHADLTLIAPGSSASNTVLKGKAAVTLAGITYSGTFGLNGPTQRDTIRARINGGAGGLGTVLPPNGYRATTLKLVISDILNGAGEALSPTADPAVLATNLPYWARLQQPAGLALQSALQITGSSWRILADGTVWFGTETYPLATQTDFVAIRFEPELARYEFGSYQPSILPGTTFKGQKVSAVVHYVHPDSLSSQLFYES